MTPTSTDRPPEDPNLIIPRIIEEELKKSYLDYAMSVIVGRALPDVRDGLKPVHRRILYAMSELANRYNQPYKKSARIVGECFVKDTLILTKQGLIPIQDITKGMQVHTQTGLQKVTEIYGMPIRKLLKITLHNGTENTVTQSQLFKIVTPDWQYKWKKASELQPGDHLIIKSVYPEITADVIVGERKLNENIAYILGQFVSDGFYVTDNAKGKYHRIVFCSTSTEIITHVVNCFQQEFKHTPTIEEKTQEYTTTTGQVLLTKIYQIRISNRAICEYFIQNFSLTSVKAHTKKIPEQILQSPQPIIFSFLSGLIDGDGSIHTNRSEIEYATVSEQLANQLQLLLQHLNIHGKKYTTTRSQEAIIMGKKVKLQPHSYSIEYHGVNAQRLAAKLHLREPRKKDRATKLSTREVFQSDHDILPWGSKKIFTELSKQHIGSGWYIDADGKKFRSGIKYRDDTKIRYSATINDMPLHLTQIKAWGIQEKLQRINSSLASFIDSVIRENISFIPIQHIQDAGSDVTYDIQVNHEHELIANGMIAHNCMGKYHPHGDVAIYDTMVRMAQDFSLRYPLIDGQGNWGSQDGDPAAHMRYSEARLRKISDEMLQDLDKETVPMVENFDASLKEPAVLPAKIPNLIINGSSGIAVGMATNIPPHNLGEVAAAIIALMDKPDIDVLELAKIMPGPDFPTGGIIQGRTGIMQYYSSGRGKLRLKSVITQEAAKGDKVKLVITEIPYQLNKADLITEIADAVKEKKIDGISDIRDESDRDGIRVVLDLKRDANAELVENQLLHTTRVQVTYGVIMLALVDGVPKVLGLKTILEHYLLHRRSVVRKRTAFDLRKAEDKEHLLEGLVIALDHIDAIITLIKKAKNTEEARTGLIANYALSEKQSNAILEMRLSRLTGLEQAKIREELAATKILIADLKDILAHEHRILAIIKNELQELATDYASNRRTQIMDGGESEIDLEDLIEPEDVVVTISNENYCKRLPVGTYRSQNRGGKGITAATTKEEDSIKHLFIANTHAWLLIFTDKGKVYWTKVYNIPEGSRQGKGKPIINLVKVEPGEKVRALIPVKEFAEDKYLFFTTRNGLVKKTNLSAYGNVRQTGIAAINIEEDDDLVSVLLTSGHDTLFLATASGNAVRFSEDDVRPTGRTSTGVRGVRLEDKDEVVDAIISHENQTILTITENGFGKRTEANEYRHISRGGKGVINIITSDRNGKVVAVKSVGEHEDMMLISKNGITIRTPVAGVSVIGRNAQGVRLMNLKAGDKVVACTVLEHVSEENDL